LAAFNIAGAVHL